MQSLATFVHSESKGISRTPLVGALAVVVVVAAIAAFTMASSPSGTAGTSSNTPTSVQVFAPAGVGSNMTLNFVPSTIRLVIGVNNTVVWVNHDSTQHDIQSTSVPSGASSFDSGTLNPATSFSVTLTVPGTYHYHCEFHPAWMQGTIVVVQG